MSCYAVVAASAGIGLVWRMKLAHAVAAAAAPLGASFTFLALVTGSLWGKPMWGTYWVWDARLTSELILLFLYFGYIAISRAFEDPRSGERAGAVLALVGVVNLPDNPLLCSVVEYRCLHQGPTVFVGSGSDISASMLVPLLIMIAGFTAFFAACLLKRIQGEILGREGDAAWVRELVEKTMRSWDEFLSMGGYAVYVWPAYGIAALVLLSNAVLPVRRLRRHLAALRQKPSGRGRS